MASVQQPDADDGKFFPANLQAHPNLPNRFYTQKGTQLWLLKSSILALTVTPVSRSVQAMPFIKLKRIS
jgi:hypothetical protein